MEVESEEMFVRAACVTAAGGILAFRTDTFYGLGVDPFDQTALCSLKSLKGREEGKPILVVISDADVAQRFVAERTPLFEAICTRHWPGPLTLVARARTEVPDELTAGTQTVGVRLPDDEEVRALVRACGGALTATSANPAGEPPARSAADVARYFPTGIRLIADGGPARTTEPSTVLDVSGRRARLLREGVITRGELERTLHTLGAALI